MNTLYIVSTPIGNLGDITFRACETLKKVDLIVCEDTRVSAKLLSHYEIQKPLLAVNDFNEEKSIDKVLGKLQDGADIALISDAGTPLVSDPGYKIVREAIAKGINVEAIPGVSAPITALTLSGFPPDKFLFVGYLPKKDKKRLDFLKNFDQMRKILKTTLIFFESPFRLLDSLEDIQKIFGDIDICVCRELTKVHQEARREKVSEAIAHFTKTGPKGELTVIF